MEAVTSNRLKIWQALSELFLDTEVDDVTIAYIARVVLETGYSAEEVHNILWSEVFPVLGANLRSVAGEWQGWTDDWLRDHLSVCERPASKRRGAVAEEIARCWELVANRLPPGFA